MWSDARVRRGRGLVARGGVYTALVVLSAWALAPTLWMLQMSLKARPALFEMPPHLLFWPTLDNYASLVTGPFLASFVNSTVAAGVSTLCALGVGVPAAYALARTHSRSRHAVWLWMLTTRMAPQIAFAIPFFLAFRALHLLDTRFGLIVVYLTFTLSLVVWMMRAYFSAIPQSLEDAAAIDGASMAQILGRVVLPLSRPGIVSTAILSFLFAWNDFFYALILTRSSSQTAPVAIANFMNYVGWDWGKITAGGMLVMLPVLVFGILVRRNIVSGLTAGAIRG